MEFVSKMNQDIGDSARGRPKNQLKRAAVLTTATDSFLRYGYARTSVESIAAKANVSKATVYSHFKNKEDLFSACIKLKCEKYDLAHAQKEGKGSSFNQRVYGFAFHFLEVLNDPDVIRLYRTVIAEVPTTSEAPSIFYHFGVKRFQSSIQEYFKVQSEFDVVSSNYEEYTELFLSLMVGQYHHKNLLGIKDKLSEEEQVHFITKRVNQFLDLVKSDLHPTDVAT